jgi:hypothetical protein
MPWQGKYDPAQMACQLEHHLVRKVARPKRVELLTF